MSGSQGSNERADAKVPAANRTRSAKFRAGTRANKKAKTIKSFASDRKKK